MTSEPDSTSGPRPPTIELKATEIGVDKSEAAPQPGTEGAPAEPETQASTARRPTESKASGGLLTAALAGIAGGVIAAVVIGAALWFAGYIPPPPPGAAPSVAKTDDPAIADLSARVAKIEGAPPAQPQSDPALASRIGAVEAATKSLNERIADASAAAQKAQAQAAAAADATKSANQNAAAHSDLDTLSARVTALDSALKKLTDDVTHQQRSADDRAARLTVAGEALRAAVERGTPFAAELAAVKSFGGDASATAALEPFAAAGVPSAAKLAHELADLVPALQQAAEPPSSNTGFIGRLENNARHLVQITPVDAPPGDDPTSVVTRIEVDTARADLAAALADIAKLSDTAKPVVATWAQKAQARNAAVAASQKLAADALAALTKPNSQ
jgi:hypothetical protein